MSEATVPASLSRARAEIYWFSNFARGVGLPLSCANIAAAGQRQRLAMLAMSECLILLEGLQVTTYRHRLIARAAPATRAKRNDSNVKESCGRASPVKIFPDFRSHSTVHIRREQTIKVLLFHVAPFATLRVDH